MLSLFGTESIRATNSPRESTGTRPPLLVSVGDPAPAQVVGRDLDLHAVTGQDADAVLAHLAAEMPEHLVAVVECDAEVTPLQGLLRASFEDECVVFCLRQAV